MNHNVNHTVVHRVDTVCTTVWLTEWTQCVPQCEKVFQFIGVDDYVNTVCFTLWRLCVLSDRENVPQNGISGII